MEIIMTMPKKEVVRLLSYNPEWADVGRSIINELLSVFGNAAVDARHIGSTAVENLKSRPIIDIAVAVRSLQEVAPYIRQLEEMDYFHRP